MRRGLLLLLALLVVLPAADVAGQEPAAQVATPSFKSGVEMVTVAATVRDRKGRLVKGLEAGDFEIFDKGVRRAIADFRPNPRPSLSQSSLISAAACGPPTACMLLGFAAHHVLSWLEPGRDEAALLTFDSRLHEVAPFTVDTRTAPGCAGGGRSIPGPPLCTMR